MRFVICKSACKNTGKLKMFNIVYELNNVN